MQRFIVINDEAHHCYKPHRGCPSRQEDREYQEAAALWFNALRLLKEQGRLAHVYDFLRHAHVALQTAAELESEIFPWTVSDFPLLDAVESGLVKIPRVPGTRTIPRATSRKYRNIYEYNSDGNAAHQGTWRCARARSRSSSCTGTTTTWLTRHTRNVGIIPVFIIVVNNIKNAVALYRWIAGGYGRNDELRDSTATWNCSPTMTRSGNSQETPAYTACTL